MFNSKFKKIMTVACVLLLQPMVYPGSAAMAKRKTPPKAFSFIVEGGKASQGECDGERKLPRLKRLKELSHTNSYMGSELQDPEIKGKPGEEMWKHFFRAKPACNAALAKTPSSIATETQEKTKKELPPDEAEEGDDEPESSEQTDQPANADAE